MEFKPLHTPRLRLRKVVQDDAPSILRGLRNDQLTEYLLIRYYSLEEVQKQMDYYAGHYANGTGCYWLMETMDTKDFVGVIGLNNYSALHRRAELGFWILPEYWRQGYTSEAGKAVLDHCFDTLLLNRVEATVETANPASINTIRKLGFTHEGTFREYEMNNGKFIDLMMFALLQRDRL